MENGWYFPLSYDAWQHSDHSNHNGTTETSDFDAELESNIVTDSLLVDQPLDKGNRDTVKKKKKRRRRNDSYETFHDKYLLSEEVLGRGANSLVALATERKTQKEYAVKIIVKYDGYDRCSVLREIDLLHFFGECPNILQLQDSYEDDQRFYLVFERMDGGHLLQHIKRNKCFTERQASLVVRDIATALKFLHDKGIAHRDLKPDNILCVKEDSIVPVVICDFNLASGISMIGSVTTPELYTPVGSAEYMAPEIVDAFVGDAPAYDKRCDLWSLGVILYIMLSGRPPFEGDCGEDCDWQLGGSCRNCQSILWHNILDANLTYPEEDWTNVSVEAKDLISHLLVKEASRRYSVENVLSHPWLAMASDNTLNTPDVLSSDKLTHRLSLVTSDAVAYRRIISERQNSDENDCSQKITRWSTPPKFGLSPPGNSRLAKRRSLKNKLNSLSLHKYDQNPDSPNLTPVQSPCEELRHLYQKDLNSSYSSPSELQKTLSICETDHDEQEVVQKEMSNVIQRLKLGLDMSQDEFDIDARTPVSTPRNDVKPRVARYQ